MLLTVQCVSSLFKRGLWGWQRIFAAVPVMYLQRYIPLDTVPKHYEYEEGSTEIAMAPHKNNSITFQTDIESVNISWSSARLGLGLGLGLARGGNGLQTSGPYLHTV